jgi:predicted NUDIX family phosphoesterase
MIERVLVVRRADFFGGTWPQGFLALQPEEAARLVARFTTSGRFVDRPAAESDPSLKQPIPYCVVRRGDELLTVRRRRAGTEERLHGLYSVGLGGHVGPEDGPEGDPNLLLRGMLRELSEEVHGLRPHASRARLVGLLNDDSNPVGEVHVGLVYHLTLPEPATPSTPPGTEEIQIREISKLQGGFRRLVEIQDLWQDPGRFETWSHLVLEAIFNPPSEGGNNQSSTLSVQGNVREEQHRRGAQGGPES